ncbi:MAG: RNase P subunit p30 family protein [Nitrososphaerota archaeon]
MPRRFVDSWLRPPDTSSLERMLKSCCELGFWAVAVEVDDKFWSEAKRLTSSYGLEIFRRVTLHPSSKGELYNLLRNVRWKCDLVSVVTNIRDVFMAAARDMRVDTVVANHIDAVYLDRHVVQVAVNSFEVVFSNIAVQGFESVRNSMRVVRTAYRSRLKLIVSSGAQDEFSLRSPRQLASIPWCLGAGPDFALNTVSTTPAKILVENRGRLEGRISPEGVWRLVEGEEEVSPN